MPSNPNITNGNTITTAQSADVCIIGSGPAGVTAAWILSQRNPNLKILLLDGSRELDYSVSGYYQQSWPDKKLLYNGTATGIFKVNEPQFLIRPYSGATSPSERERVYGGTSTHWGGQSRPLDPIDFEARPGFPGWPITRADLDPYYAQVSVLNHLCGDYGTDGTNFTAEYWAAQMNANGRPASVPDLTGFDNAIYQFMDGQWLNFATRTFDGGKKISDVARVIVNASVLDIVEQGGTVQSLRVASMTDGETPQKATEFTVTARAYVLACGAVANARQLLLAGIGGPLVGRYFMCHPLTQLTAVRTTQPGFLTTQEYNLMNKWSNPPCSPNGINYTEGRFQATAELARQEGIGRAWFRSGSSYNMYMEMAPNYDSYVRLDSSVDPVFSQPQTYVDWQFTDLDQTTYETNCRRFSESRQPTFSSIISWEDWKNLATSWVVNGHHIGTTRMSPTNQPGDGVVDKNLQVFGIGNLFVAGSSVFPTTGLSNPTMTIIALSVRLGERLAAAL